MGPDGARYVVTESSVHAISGTAARLKLLAGSMIEEGYQDVDGCSSRVSGREEGLSGCKVQIFCFLPSPKTAAQFDLALQHERWGVGGDFELIRPCDRASEHQFFIHREAPSSVLV